MPRVDRCWRVVCFVWLVVGLLQPVQSQNVAGISSGGQRVFLVGFTPVIGPGGGVGGIDVDVDGVLNRIATEPGAELVELRVKAMKGVAADIRRKSPMRKLSLTRLEAEIAKQAQAQTELTTDVLYMAGLQRIEYVFVAPESNDIVIAGPAEGWVLQGDEMVGASSGQAVLRLDDFLDALQGKATAIEDDGGGISCSIDPTESGMARVQRMFNTRQLQVSEASLKMMERQLGDQTVTLTGVRPSGHFARVMVGADYMMKRIAMGFDPAPVASLPSYIQLMQRGPATTQLMAPRWWLATNYESLQKSEDGLAWQLKGRGLKVLSEHGFLNARGELVNAGRPSPIAKMWADKFTSHYEDIATKIPVFGQLRGCVDSAVIAALFTQESLPDRADCPLALLSNADRLIGEDFSIPRHVPSKANAIRGRRGWIISVSGGVELDTWNVIQRVETNLKLAPIRDEALKAGESNAESWWWD